MTGHTPSLQKSRTRGHDAVDVFAAAVGVKQQQQPAASRGSIPRTAVVLADDRFDRGDGPEPACA